MAQNDLSDNEGVNVLKDEKKGENRREPNARAEKNVSYVPLGYKTMILSVGICYSKKGMEF